MMGKNSGWSPQSKSAVILERTGSMSNLCRIGFPYGGSFIDCSTSTRRGTPNIAIAAKSGGSCGPSPSDSFPGGTSLNDSSPIDAARPLPAHPLRRGRHSGPHGQAKPVWCTNPADV